MKLSGLNPSWQLILFLHFAVKQMTLRWHFQEDFIRLTHTASAGGWMFSIIFPLIRQQAPPRSLTVMPVGLPEGLL